VAPLQTMRAKVPKPKMARVLKVKQAPVKPDRKNQGTKKDPTCKRCGRRKVSDGQAKGKHGCRVKKTSKAYCKVAEEMYLPGYPKAGYFIEE
jgi:hypothetical protein